MGIFLSSCCLNFQHQLARSTGPSIFMCSLPSVSMALYSSGFLPPSDCCTVLGCSLIFSSISHVEFLKACSGSHFPFHSSYSRAVSARPWPHPVYQWFSQLHLPAKLRVMSTCLNVSRVPQRQPIQSGLFQPWPLVDTPSLTGWFISTSDWPWATQLGQPGTWDWLILETILIVTIPIRLPAGATWVHPLFS